MANGENARPSSGILQSWKEIAAYFGVTIRTVQNWEEEKGLPVQRMPGPRGRVWARIEDLEAWRSRRTDLEPNASAPVAAQAVPRLGTPRWIWWAAAALTLLVIGVSSARVLWNRSRERNISKVRVEGDTLVAVDKRGRVRWTHTFDHPVQDPGGLKANWGDLAPVIQDIDGDGAPDVAFPLIHKDERESHEIHYFDSGGAFRWKYRPAFALKNALSETYFGPWKFRAIRTIPRVGGGADLLVAISHIEMFPGILVRIGPDGRAGQAYYHAGHLVDLLVWPQGPEGRPVVYVTANANSYRMASVIALDPDRMEGASREPEADKEHTFVGLPEARELARVLIPPTPLGLVDFKSNTVRKLKLDGGRLVAEIVESVAFARGIISVDPGYYVIFTPRLQFDHYRTTDLIEKAYRAYHSKGLLPSEDPRPDIERAIRGMRTLVAWQ